MSWCIRQSAARVDAFIRKCLFKFCSKGIRVGTCNVEVMRRVVNGAKINAACQLKAGHARLAGILVIAAAGINDKIIKIGMEQR